MACSGKPASSLLKMSLQPQLKKCHHLNKYIILKKPQTNKTKTNKQKPHRTKKPKQFNHIHETSAFTLRSSTTVSANPTTYIATATAFAKAKISPIDPPNSGPRLLEIRQYAPPAGKNYCYFSTAKCSGFAHFSHISNIRGISAFSLTNIIDICPILIEDTDKKRNVL